MIENRRTPTDEHRTKLTAIRAINQEAGLRINEISNLTKIEVSDR